MTEEEKIQALKARWIGQEERIEKIIEDAKKEPAVNWTVHLGKTESWEKLPDIDDVSPCSLLENKNEIIKANIDDLSMLKDLRGIRLRHKNLFNINLCYTFLQHADLWGANLQEANLKEAKLQEANLFDAKLQKADLEGVELQEAHLESAQLKEANLKKAHLQEAILFDANLQKADLRKANLQEADLRKAQLQKADLRGANLQKADLGKAILKKADLSRAELQYAILVLADLKNTNLTNAQLQDAHLEYAQLQKADLSKADFTNAFLEGANFKDVILDSNTNFGFNKNRWLKNIFLFSKINILKLCNLILIILYKSSFNKIPFLKRTILVDTKEYMLRDESEKRYSAAQDIYRQLKKAYKDQGMYHEAGLFYYREQVCRRKAKYPIEYDEKKKFSSLILSLPNIISRFLNFMFFDVLFGYGEKIQRLISFMIFMIVGSAGVYWKFGEGIVRDCGQHISSRGEALYFSIVTFTTLGFGDFHPDHSSELGQLMKYWIAGEALCGALLISLALIAFARISIRD